MKLCRYGAPARTPGSETCSVWQVLLCCASACTPPNTRVTQSDLKVRQLPSICNVNSLLIAQGCCRNIHGAKVAAQVCQTIVRVSVDHCSPSGRGPSWRCGRTPHAATLLPWASLLPAARCCAGCARRPRSLRQLPAACGRCHLTSLRTLAAPAATLRWFERYERFERFEANVTCHVSCDSEPYGRHAGGARAAAQARPLQLENASCIQPHGMWFHGRLQA